MQCMRFAWSASMHTEAMQKNPYQEMLAFSAATALKAILASLSASSFSSKLLFCSLACCRRPLPPCCSVSTGCLSSTLGSLSSSKLLNEQVDKGVQKQVGVAVLKASAAMPAYHLVFQPVCQPSWSVACCCCQRCLCYPQSQACSFSHPAQ